MATITVAGALQPSVTNTPIDARSRVAALQDIYSIQAPAVGGVVYVEETGRHYVITELEDLKVGALTTPNGKVKTYRELDDKTAADIKMADGVSTVEATVAALTAAAEATKAELEAADAQLAEGLAAAEQRLANTDQGLADYIDEIKLKDHTAFLLWASGELPAGTYHIPKVTADETIASGTYESNPENFDTITLTEPITKGSYQNHAASDPMTHHIRIASNTPPEYQDVRIDWGDGTETLLSSENVENDYVPYYYNVRHTYENEGFYIMKMYGKQYFRISSYGEQTEDTGYYVNTNLICRVFEDNLPIASHLQDFNKTCECARKLTSVAITRNFDRSYVCNVQYMFNHCTNLKTVSGFKYYRFQYLSAADNMFSNCTNLTSSDFKLPDGNQLAGTGFSGIYANCGKLSTSLKALLPPNGFAQKNVALHNAFKNCTSLPALPSGLDAILWKDITRNWSCSGCFTGSSVASQAPVSWGGDLADAEVAPVEQQLADIRSDIANVELTPGPEGKSAFEVWKESTGNAEATEAEYFEAIKGEQGPKGDTGKPFKIEKVFASVEEMNADTTVEEGAIVIILTEDTAAEDYGKLYVKAADGYSFLVDMSVVGAQGIQGPTGASAYDVWVAAGNQGDEAAFLASLKGTDGADLTAAAPTEFTSWTATYPIIEVTCEDVSNVSVAAVFIDTDEGELQLPHPSDQGITKIVKNTETGKMYITFGNNVPVFETGRIQYHGAYGGTVDTGDRPEARSIYYGYIQGTEENGVYDTEHLTEEMILNSATVTAVNAGEFGPTKIAGIPAGSIVFVLVPAGYTAYKDDGLGGLYAFSENNGTAGTGSNGGHTLQVNGALYNVYGEFTLLNNADMYVYSVAAQ